MSGQEDEAQRRQPLLFGVIGGLIGVVIALAVGLYVLLGGPGTGTPTLAPSQAAQASNDVTAGPSIAPGSLEPTGLPVETAAATEALTPAPATEGPTAGPSANPSASASTKPVIVTWVTPAYEDCTGSTAGMIHVSWSVENATGVTISIDGPGIYDSYPGTSGETDLPYGCEQDPLKHTYTLKTTGSAGGFWVSSTKTVRTRAPSIVSFTIPSHASCAMASGTVMINFSYEIKYATGIRLGIGGIVYGDYGGKTGGPISVPYDCSKASQVFKIQTTGGYGTAATRSITVYRQLPI